LFIQWFSECGTRYFSRGAGGRERRVLAALLALMLDALFGDPPSSFHPVAWMGSWIALLRKWAPRGSALASFLYGAGAVGGSACVLGLGGWWTAGQLRGRWFGWIVEGAILSLILAWRGLMRAGRAVEEPLGRGEIDEARRQLGWHLVSRDVSQLDEGLVAAATIESLAENGSDSVVAPLFWYGVGGMPAVVVYRFLNTADAMLGYRDVEREWLGKSAARADDLVNLVPARLTALLIVGGAALSGGSSGSAWRIWRRDARQTDSPNAGQPMSAAAGALEVELEKVGQYRLGEGLARPKADDIGRARRLITVSVLSGIVAAGAAVILSSARRV